MEKGIVNLGNLLAVSPPRATADLLIRGNGVGRACLKIVGIYLNLTMPAQFIIRNGAVTVDSRNTPQSEPFDVDIPAGQYDIEVKFAAVQFVSKVCPQLMQPPFTPCTLEVDR